MIVLYKEFFTTDELRYRGLQLTSKPNALARDNFKVLKTNFVERTSECDWYDVVCEPSSKDAEDKIRQTLSDDPTAVVLRCAFPAPGAVVEEGFVYGPRARQAQSNVTYTYLSTVKMEMAEGFMSVCCIKMSMADGRMYEDKFHLLSPYTSLYTVACLGDGHATMSSSSGMKTYVKVFK